jgi:hypothetical protein
MLPGGPKTINGRLAERVDPFRRLRRTIWGMYPDPFWHLRIISPCAGGDRFKLQRDAALTRLPTSDFVAQQWAMEQRILGLAALRRMTLNQEARPPRPGYRPMSSDEWADVVLAFGLSGAAAWQAAEDHSVPAATGAGLAFAQAARLWQRLRRERQAH